MKFDSVIGLLSSVLISGALLNSAVCGAAVSPLLTTEWGQDGVWKQKTPLLNGTHTYPGCTTIASAQVLYYYQYQDHAQSAVKYTLEHDGNTGPNIENGVLKLDLRGFHYDWSKFAKKSSDSRDSIANTAEFIYHVGVTLNAQFGGGEGSSATGRQIENAFRYQWGFNKKSRRVMSIIAKTAFQYTDEQWADLIYSELDAGRPVLYMALQVGGTAGHSFVIDGYSDDGLVHVNWGWGGKYNGYYDVNSLEDPSGRQWSREPMIFRALEPENGFAAAMQN